MAATETVTDSLPEGFQLENDTGLPEGFKLVNDSGLPEGFTLEPVANPDTPSLQPVLQVGAFTPNLPPEPVPQKPRVEFNPFQPIPAANRVPEIRIGGGEDESLLGFIPEIPRIPEPLAQVLGNLPLVAGAAPGALGVKLGAGVANAGIGMAKGITTPLGLVSFGEGGIANAVRPIFAAQMGAGAVQAVPGTIQALQEGDIQKAAQEAAGGVASAFLAGHLAETPLDRIAREVEASPTPITAGTVAAMREAVTAPNRVRIFAEDFRPKVPTEAPGAMVPIESIPTKPAEVTNAVQEQGPNEGVLRSPQPEVGLPQVGEGNAKPEVAPGGAFETTPEVKAPEATAGETAAAITTPEASLSEGLDKFPAKSPTLEAAKEHIQEQQSEGLGISATPLPVPRGTPLLELAKNVAKEVTGIREFTPFRETLNKWVGSIQESDLKTRELTKKIDSRVPSSRKQVAITNWMQAAGDATVLSDRAKATKNRKLQRGYLDAMHLTPDEVGIANELRKFYADKAVELQNAGVLKNTVDNYVTQIWERGVGTGTAAQFAGKLAKNFKFSRERTFPTFFEGEQAGYKPATKDISKLVAIYSAEADKVLATRKMIEDLTTKTAEDGRPLAVPGGIAKLLPPKDAAKEPGTQIVLPNLTGKKFNDYVPLDHPALSDWKWVNTDDTTGIKTMVLGDLKMHPDIAVSMRKALSRSWLSKWYDEPSSAGMRLLKGGVRALDVGGSEMKRTMLGFFSPFHIVQEGTHAIGHRVNPFFGLPEIKAGDVKIQDAMNHGLMLASDHTGAQQFKEGIAGPGLVKKIPGIGQWAEDFSNWTFQTYIPKLKYATYEKMVARNTRVFAKELSRGEVTPDDIKALSAEQSNAAYGHLNYADLGRDPTWQHFLRTFLLAPDFLEARGRFTGQAIKGLASKTGREQLAALGTLAATFWVAARIGNKLNDDDWHFDHPFEVKVGNRWLSMRSVPEDLFKLFQDPHKFINGRLSPMFGQTGLELITKRNYRGEKIETPQILEEALTRTIPITLRDIPGLRDLTESGRNNPVSPWQSMLGTMGLHVSRYSPITETYKLAADWNKQQGYKPDTGTYPVSKYQQLRYALEDADFEKAQAEIQKLRQEGLTKDKLRKGFAESVNHPFTKSKATDEAFRYSLEGKDRATYDEAVRQRKLITQRLESLVR